MLRRNRRHGHQEASMTVRISRKGPEKAAQMSGRQDMCREESNAGNQSISTDEHKRSERRSNKSSTMATRQLRTTCTMQAEMQMAKWQQAIWWYLTFDLPRTLGLGINWVGETKWAWRRLIRPSSNILTWAIPATLGRWLA
jgi:hypothetical protein